jgi:hypothetical protein
MPAYVAALSCLQDDKPVPYETSQITAENDEDAVRKAVEWRVTTVTTIDRRTWLEVFREGESRAFHSKEIARIR